MGSVNYVINVDANTDHARKALRDLNSDLTSLTKKDANTLLLDLKFDSKTSIKQLQDELSNIRSFFPDLNQQFDLTVFKAAADNIKQNIKDMGFVFQDELNLDNVKTSLDQITAEIDKSKNKFGGMFKIPNDEIEKFRDKLENEFSNIINLNKLGDIGKDAFNELYAQITKLYSDLGGNNDVLSGKFIDIAEGYTNIVEKLSGGSNLKPYQKDALNQYNKYLELLTLISNIENQLQNNNKNSEILDVSDSIKKFEELINLINDAIQKINELSVSISSNIGDPLKNALDTSLIDNWKDSFTSSLAQIGSLIKDIFGNQTIKNTILGWDLSNKFRQKNGQELNEFSGAFNSKTGQVIGGSLYDTPDKNDGARDIFREAKKRGITLDTYAHSHSDSMIAALSSSVFGEEFKVEGAPDLPDGNLKEVIGKDIIAFYYKFKHGIETEIVKGLEETLVFDSKSFYTKYASFFNEEDGSIDDTQYRLAEAYEKYGKDLYFMENMFPTMKDEFEKRYNTKLDGKTRKSYLDFVYKNKTLPLIFKDVFGEDFNFDDYQKTYLNSEINNSPILSGNGDMFGSTVSNLESIASLLERISNSRFDNLNQLNVLFNNASNGYNSILSIEELLLEIDRLKSPEYMNALNGDLNRPGNSDADNVAIQNKINAVKTFIEWLNLLKDAITGLSNLSSSAEFLGSGTGRGTDGIVSGLSAIKDVLGELDSSKGFTTFVESLNTISIQLTDIIDKLELLSQNALMSDPAKLEFTKALNKRLEDYYRFYNMMNQIARSNFIDEPLTGIAGNNYVREAAGIETIDDANAFTDRFSLLSIKQLQTPEERIQRMTEFFKLLQEASDYEAKMVDAKLESASAEIKELIKSNSVNPRLWNRIKPLVSENTRESNVKLNDILSKNISDNNVLDQVGVLIRQLQSDISGNFLAQLNKLFTDGTIAKGYLTDSYLNRQIKRYETAKGIQSGAIQTQETKESADESVDALKNEETEAANLVDAFDDAAGMKMAFADANAKVRESVEESVPKLQEENEAIASLGTSADNTYASIDKLNSAIASRNQAIEVNDGQATSDHSKEVSDDQIKALNSEATEAKEVAVSMNEAAEAKKEFTKANEGVEKQAKKSTKAVEGETKSADLMVDSVNGTGIYKSQTGDATKPDHDNVEVTGFASTRTNRTRDGVTTSVDRFDYAKITKALHDNEDDIFKLRQEIQDTQSRGESIVALRENLNTLIQKNDSLLREIMDYLNNPQYFPEGAPINATDQFHATSGIRAEFRRNNQHQKNIKKLSTEDKSLLNDAYNNAMSQVKTLLSQMLSGAGKGDLNISNLTDQLSFAHSVLQTIADDFSNIYGENDKLTEVNNLWSQFVFQTLNKGATKVDDLIKKLNEYRQNLLNQGKWNFDLNNPNSDESVYQSMMTNLGSINNGSANIGDEIRKLASGQDIDKVIGFFEMMALAVNSVNSELSEEKVRVKELSKAQEYINRIRRILVEDKSNGGLLPQDYMKEFQQLSFRYNALLGGWSENGSDSVMSDQAKEADELTDALSRLVKFDPLITQFSENISKLKTLFAELKSSALKGDDVEVARLNGEIKNTDDIVSKLAITLDGLTHSSKYSGLYDNVFDSKSVNEINAVETVIHRLIERLEELQILLGRDLNTGFQSEIDKLLKILNGQNTETPRPSTFKELSTQISAVDDIAKRAKLNIKELGKISIANEKGNILVGTGKYITEFKEKLDALRVEFEDLQNAWVPSTNNNYTNIKEQADLLLKKYNALINKANEFEKINKKGTLIETTNLLNGTDLSSVKNEIESALSGQGYSNIKFDDFKLGAKTITGTLTDGNSIAKEFSISLGEVDKGFRLITQDAGTSRKSFSLLGAVGKELVGMFSYYFTARTLMTKIISGFTNGTNALKQYNSALTTISYTMNLTTKQLDDLGKSAINMADDLSMSLDNAMSIYQIYANMNTTAKEIAETGRATAILSNLSGADASTAADQVQGIIQQFGLLDDATANTAKTSMHVVDVLNSISSSVAVDYAKGINVITEAVTATGQVAKDAGKMIA